MHAYTAGSVVGSYDGRLMLLGVIVFVGIGATVPVGTEQYAPAAVGVVGTDDVARLQQGAVVGHEVGVLVVDFGSELLQLGSQVFAAGFVGSGVGHAGTEVGLCLHVLVSTVGIEGRHVDLFFSDVFCLVGGRFLIAAACYGCEHQQQAA